MKYAPCSPRLTSIWEEMKLPKTIGNKCPDCQKRIADLGLKNSHDLQLWFSAQMAEYLKSKGKKAIFWGDVVYNDGYPLPDNIVYNGGTIADTKIWHSAMPSAIIIPSFAVPTTTPISIFHSLPGKDMSRPAPSI